MSDFFKRLIVLQGTVFVYNCLPCNFVESSSIVLWLSSVVISVLHLTVSGAWSSWSGWSNCSVECGDGQRVRSRTCSKPRPHHGGSNCSGNSEESIQCKLKECAGEHCQFCCCVYWRSFWFIAVAKEEKIAQQAVKTNVQTGFCTIFPIQRHLWTT